MSEHESSVLTWKIRQALALAPIAGGQRSRIDGLKISIERMQGESMDFLSKRIVADLLSQIERSS
ncbi:MAG: hypothetical protein PHE55_05955 [Methylococcaceae bacterium]|nr:hypothetical protein [Methylococcaceae bacterium]